MLQRKLLQIVSKSARSYMTGLGAKLTEVGWPFSHLPPPLHLVLEYGRNSARSEEHRPTLACVKVCHWRGVCSRKLLGWDHRGGRGFRGVRKLGNLEARHRGDVNSTVHRTGRCLAARAPGATLLLSRCSVAAPPPSLTTCVARSKIL
jgi:hypothetical protein